MSQLDGLIAIFEEKESNYYFAYKNNQVKYYRNFYDEFGVKCLMPLNIYDVPENIKESAIEALMRNLHNYQRNDPNFIPFRLGD